MAMVKLENERGMGTTWQAREEETPVERKRSNVSKPSKDDDSEPALEPEAEKGEEELKWR